MTERERKILMGEDIQPRTADEITYANVSGGGGIFVVTGNPVNRVVTLTKTWSEIRELFEEGFGYIRIDWGEDEGYSNYVITSVYAIKGDGDVITGYLVEIEDGQGHTFDADSPDGYPARDFN